MSRVVLFIQKEGARCGFIIEEEETCCAGLAGICLGWDVPACSGACFEATQGRDCFMHQHFQLLLLAGLGSVSPCSQHQCGLLHREQCSGYADVGLGFLLCKMGF